MLSKSLIQISVDGWSCVPYLLFTWGQTMVEVMKTMVTTLKSSHACTATLSAPNPEAATTSPRLHQKFLNTHWQVWVSLFCGHCSFLLGPAHKVLLCPPRVYFPALCKFWQLYGGVNGDLLQEGLCHTQGCCIQSLCPFSRPLQTRTSTGDAQTQFCLSLCGVPGSWCTQGLFELSKHLWQELGFILNANSPFLPSCWGFSFAPGSGLSPHSCSTAYHLTGFSLTLDAEYLHRASPGKHSHCS